MATLRFAKKWKIVKNKSFLSKIIRGMQKMRATDLARFQELIRDAAKYDYPLILILNEKDKLLIKSAVPITDNLKQILLFEKFSPNKSLLYVVAVYQGKSGLDFVVEKYNASRLKLMGTHSEDTSLKSVTSEKIQDLIQEADAGYIDETYEDDSVDFFVWSTFH